MRDTESYSLKAFFHLNSESVLVGQNTKLFMRPKLTLNRRATSIENLKSSCFEMTITDHDGKQVNHTVKDPKLSDEEDFVFEFMVPSNTQNITVKLSGSVKNFSKKAMEQMATQSHTFTVKHHRDDKCLHELYLKQIGADYFIYCLGKNGEPLRNQKVNINVKHIDYQEAIHHTLTLDTMGRVKLGPLSGVEKVHATVNAPDVVFSDTWNIINEADQWTASSEINIVAGESVEIPINYEGATEALSTYQLSLKKMRASQTLANLTKSIKIEKSRMGAYNQINLRDLEVGKYILKLNMTSSQRQFISINVH